MVKKINTDAIKTALVKTTGVLIRTKKSPDQLLGDLFLDVQNQRIYPDGKTFVDLVPKNRIKSIQEEYALLRQDPQFDLREFVGRHFYDLSTTIHKKDPFEVRPEESIEDHIARLWSHLERRNRVDRGSLIALPHRYIVPGGRFNEQFYWDTYFIMLGLAAEGKWTLIEGMIKNYAHMIRKYGFIPTANRTYFLSRSQPPFFALMVQLLAEHKGKKVLREYLPLLIQERRFWMKGIRRLENEEHAAYRRVVRMPNRTLMNRYYDNNVTPRPESLLEDVETVQEATDRQADRVFLHLRAAAESGWDFSARWLTNPKDLHTIHTADIIPVDLNSLMYTLENLIADGCRASFQPYRARLYRRAANYRKAAIQEYCWSEDEGMFMDYNFHHREKTGFLSLAAVFPLYVKIATDEQAQKVADRLRADFLKEGGLVTTLLDTGQQWDAPNGWAPLQWVAIEGLRNYGHNELADDITARWMAVTEKVFDASHRLVEKYDVSGGSGLGGGGEYVLQDGFGWTNGVYAALKRRKNEQKSD
jgi:alpha,alpha-trehalase